MFQQSIFSFGEASEPHCWWFVVAVLLQASCSIGVCLVVASVFGCGLARVGFATLWKLSKRFVLTWTGKWRRRWWWWKFRKRGQGWWWLFHTIFWALICLSYLSDLPALHKANGSLDNHLLLNLEAHVQSIECMLRKHIIIRRSEAASSRYRVRSPSCHLTEAALLRNIKPFGKSATCLQCCFCDWTV